MPTAPHTCGPLDRQAAEDVPGLPSELGNASSVGQRPARLEMPGAAN